MVCVVTAVRVHVLYCDSGRCTWFCVVAVVVVHVLCFDSVTCTWFVL